MPSKTLDDYIKQIQTTTKQITKEKENTTKYRIIGFYKETQFRETPIGKIPKEWEIVKLKDITYKIKAGGTPKVSKREFWNGDIPFVKIEDLTSSGKYLYSVKTFITEQGLRNSSAWLVPRDSLLIAMYGSMGEVAINKIKVTTNQAILGIIPKEKVLVEYLYYWFLYFKPKWRIYAKWTTQPNLTAEIIRNIHLPFPPIEEQRGIVEVLSSVDRAIEETSRLLEKLERIKRALLQELLTKGIGHREFKETPIGKIPKKWKVVNLGNIGSFQYGITTPARSENTGIKLLRITDIDIKNGRINWDDMPYCRISERDFKRYKLNIGDILFARIGATTGKTCYVNRDEPAVFGSYLIRFIPSTKEINMKYLYYFTQSTQYWVQVNKLKGGQLKKGLNTKLLARIKIPLPQLEEQRRIVNILSSVDEWIMREIKRKKKLKRLKKGLMDILLTGKVRIRVARVG